MAKARAKRGVSLKGIGDAIDEVMNELASMQKGTATPKARSSMSSLERVLTGIKMLVEDKCLPGMFSSFEDDGAETGTRARTRTARKSSRK